MMILKKASRTVKSMLHPTIGNIWCLHRVVENRSIMPSNRELEITPNFLKQHIESHLAKGFRFVDIDTIIADLTHRRHQKNINISFDDGFEDIYIHAFPIFKHYNIPFTLYLSTGMPESTTDLWWIQLEQQAHGNVQWYEHILRQCYEGTSPMADTMHRLTHTKPDFDLCKQMSLNWEQIIEMVESGLCTIGSHSVTHPGMTRITAETILLELTESKKTIENHIHKSIHHFSYPHSMHSEEISILVQSAQYSTAVLGYGGKVRYGTNPFLLPRTYITEP